MRVIIDPALFAPQSPFDFEMIRLLSAAVDRPHQVLVDGGDAGERLRDDWLAQRDRALLPPFKRLFEQAFGASFTRHPPSVTLDVTTRRPEQVHGEHRATAGPARASGLVTAPLGVLLENAVNDAAFLQLVTPPGPLRQWLDGAIAGRWIGFVHGGGGDLEKQLGRLDPWQRLRTWAMCDAESWDPKVEYGQVTRFRNAAQRPPAVPLVVLLRRAIENYLPMPALAKWLKRIEGQQYHPRAKDCVAALAALDSHAARFPLRHHYHYANGFQHLPPEIPSEYDPFRKNGALHGGMGEQVKKVWAENLRAQGTADHWLDDAWLAADGQGHELRGIIGSLRARI